VGVGHDVGTVVRLLNHWTNCWYSSARDVSHGLHVDHAALERTARQERARHDVPDRSLDRELAGADEADKGVEVEGV
jgi:hypothetical protein